MPDHARQLESKRILYLARDPGDLEAVPRRLRSVSPPVVAYATRRMGEALTLLSRERFDLAVCPVDVPRDVATVIRLRKASPGTPVLALVPGEDSEAAALSLQMGASAAFRRESDALGIAETLRQALQMRQLAREVRSTVAYSFALSREIRELAARARLLATDTLSRLAANPAEGFEPLVVDDDPGDAYFFVRALRKAGLSRRLPVVRSAREAMDYLSGSGLYADRALYPAPSIVILDFNLDHETGEQVLRFVRMDPELKRIPVVLLSSSENPVELARMVELGVSAHVVKPPTATEFDEVVHLILDFWQVFRSQGAGP